jgi:4a-hydroxytetrahydrobiopterin dehydratase
MLPLGIINERMDSLNNWALEGNCIVKDYSFDNFKVALEFVNKVGEIAEEQEHHPDILVSYNKVRLSLTTHSEKGLTSKDFEVAEAIDKLG